MIFNSSKYNSHWLEKELSELGSFRRGKSRHRPRNDPNLFVNGIYPLVQTGEVKQANLYITSHHSCYNELGLSQSESWPKNTLCITIAANIAETALLGYPMCFPDSIVGFNSYPHESSEIFMHYVFTYIRKSIQNSASGSIQDNISIDYLTGLKFKVPLKEYQDKIVSVLSMLDKKIDINNRINTELETMAKTLYDYWFVQFDFPDSNGKPYKTSGGKMVYNTTLKREIPAGWNDSLLGDFIELERGVTYSKEDVCTQNDEDTVGVLRATNITGNTIDINDLILIPAYKANSRQILNMFDILMVMSSGSKEHVGKNGIYYFEKPHAFGAFCSKITPVSKLRCFINTFFQSNWFSNYIKNQCLGTNINNLTNTHVSMCEIINPAPDVVALFEKKVMPIYSKLASNTQENKQLVKLRDWLLPLLMNGQVTVK